MLHDYPKDIQAAAAIDKPTKEQEKAAKRFGAVGGLIILGTLLAFGSLHFHNEQVSFLQVFEYLFIVAMTWNVVDLLVMDWLIVCTITPKWVVIRGTEGCKGYKDYLFHFNKVPKKHISRSLIQVSTPNTQSKCLIASIAFM